jgi:hypothetical protein
MVAVSLSAAVVALCGLARWWLYLRLCRHVFDQTRDPAALRHVAAPARAFGERTVRLPRRGSG